ncbi:MAG: M50 family metallopeptidase [Candidatus Diapherotrites archaeon]
MSLFEIIFFYTIFAIIITYIIKKTTKFDTYVIGTIIKTEKPLPLFERLSKHKKIIDAIANFGLFLGFGALAIDFVHGRKKSKLARIGIFLISFLLLSGTLIGVDFVLGNNISKNSIVGSSFILLATSFGLLGFSGFTLFALILQGFDIIIKIFEGTKACPGVAPLVPGVEIPNVPITPPLHAWISLLIILVVHEAMHGITGMRHGFKVKSTGVILFGILPIGAFVEPDEKEIENAEPKKVLPFLSSGPAANLVVMVLSLGLMIFLLFAFNITTNYLFPGIEKNTNTGVIISGIAEETELCGAKYPSTAKGVLFEGDIIKKVNGVDVNNVPILLSLLQKDRFSEKEFLIERNSKEIEVKIKPNETGQFGFMASPLKPQTENLPQSFLTYSSIVSLVIEFVYWLLLLNFLVATVNFIPLSPFDGGRIAQIIFPYYISSNPMEEKQKKKSVSNFLKVVILLLLLLNALPLFI